MRKFSIFFRWPVEAYCSILVLVEAKAESAQIMGRRALALPMDYQSSIRNSSIVLYYMYILYLYSVQYSTKITVVQYSTWWYSTASTVLCILDYSILCSFSRLSGESLIQYYRYSIQSGTV